MNHFTAHLSHLSHIELLGPFLVRKEGWISFFQSLKTPLTGFLIKQSPRFDLACCEALVANHKNLHELRLSEVGKMGDDFLPLLGCLEGLRSLDLSYPGSSLGDGAMIDLLCLVGKGLERLVLSGNEGFTDVLLVDGIKAYCRSVRELVLTNLPEITDEGVKALFEEWTNPAIQHIDFGRCHGPSSNALEALLDHSGSSLIWLSINSWKECTEEAIASIGSKAPKLQAIDVGFCRVVDNFTIKVFFEGCA